MSMETKAYLVGQLGPDEIEIPDETPHHTSYEDYCFHRYGEFMFQNSSTKNMEKLWTYFHKSESYPEYYRGISKKVAICKCPDTGEEKWYNSERCLNAYHLVKGSNISVEFQNKDGTYTRDFIFMGWVNGPVHEWKMTKGTTLMLAQNIIDTLSPQDKRYLKINR